MKVEDVKHFGKSAVSSQLDVTIAINKEESHELKAALALIDKYKKVAIETYRKENKLDPRNSDWCEVSYVVKNDKVIVSIKDGMAG